MTTYIVSYRHHSVGRAPQIRVTGTLTQAKRAASREFGDGFLDHELTVHEVRGEGDWMPDHYLVASRRIGGRKWHCHD
jgi:hypothetical protein